MPIMTNNPVPLPGRVTYLGSGSGTATGTGAIQVLGSVSLGDLGNKRLIIDVTMVNTSVSASGVTFYVSPQNNAITNAIPLATGASGTGLIGQAILNRHPTDAAKTLTTYWKSIDTGGGVIWNCDINTGFNLSGAATIYFLCGTASAVDKNFTYRYTAYIIG